VSDCGSHAFSVIAFVGSVFSPYYHFSGRRDPENHVAINVALYSPARDLWSMTERGKRWLERSPTRMVVGPSMVKLDGDRVVIDFNEIAPPFPPKSFAPRRMRGRITLTPRIGCETAYALDEVGRHMWWPKAPLSHVAVESDAFPEGGWNGAGYHDLNWGSRPLESDFIGWDWARGTSTGGKPVVLYDAVLRNGARRSLSLQFSRTGAAPDAFVAPPRQALKRGWWGVNRAIACDAAQKPRVTRGLEDTPFYTRALVETCIGGTTLAMLHESLDCTRLANPVVRMMLPFRMPRRA
jgi:carotenoid 1,2-hydratase